MLLELFAKFHPREIVLSCTKHLVKLYQFHIMQTWTDWLCTRLNDLLILCKAHVWGIQWGLNLQQKIFFGWITYQIIITYIWILLICHGNTCVSVFAFVDSDFIDLTENLCCWMIHNGSIVIYVYVLFDKYCDFLKLNVQICKIQKWVIDCTALFNEMNEVSQI